MKKLKKSPPYEFVLEDLADIITTIKPMFGAYGIYREDQILMILRKKDKTDKDTGMWVAVVNGEVESLKKQIPELRDLEMFGPGPTSWQVVGEDLIHFEEICIKICDLIRNKDLRIGRTPQSRLRSKSKRIKRVIK